MKSTVILVLWLIFICKAEVQRGWMKTDNKDLSSENFVEDNPIQIKTKSALGSGDMIEVEFESTDGFMATAISILFSKNPMYQITDCKGPTYFDVALPTTTTKVWTISYERRQSVYPRIKMHCNNLLVVDLQVSRENCNYITWETPLAAEIERYVFGPDDTASIEHRLLYYKCGKIKYLVDADDHCVRPEGDAAPGRLIVGSTNCANTEKEYCRTHDDIVRHHLSGLCVEQGAEEYLVLGNDCVTTFPYIQNAFPGITTCWKLQSNNRITLAEDGCLNNPHIWLSEATTGRESDCGKRIINKESCACLSRLKNSDPYSTSYLTWVGITRPSRRSWAECQSFSFNCSKSRLLTKSACKRSQTDSSCKCRHEQCHKDYDVSKLKDGDLKTKNICARAIASCENVKRCTL